ncbi:hypothetical protein BpHYR1_002619 [Brachionus plicatilis]|uniref:Uncharacterized protein n=1 Tax=Brachionus plicatilis TaxID=10195 RepID=A0A3M7SF63_BRAPC|nr:hypothetical protein BpHYR1_002619 [Brachionus plicatilis]
MTCMDTRAASGLPCERRRTRDSTPRRRSSRTYRPDGYTRLPSASNILGMSKCFSAMSKARFKFLSGSSLFSLS